LFEYWNEVCLGYDPSRHVASIGSWIKAIRDDPLLLQRAAAGAKKIVGFIKELEQQRVQRIEIGRS
jgi:antirestriction protein ArdC